MTGVLAPAGRYRAAVAELPLSTRHVETAGGAVVVVTGDGWIDAAHAAAAAGAVAVIAALPGYSSAADIRRLADEVAVPVILERALLRADAATDAASARTADEGSSSPRAVVAGATAPHGSVAIIAREAVGWLRVLAGASPAFVAADGELALLETPAGIAASLSIVATGRPGGGAIRAHALGEVLTAIEVEGDRVRIVTASARGRLSSPARFESSARLTVRRALAAVQSGEHSRDLRQLAEDTAVVEQILAAAP